MTVDALAALVREHQPCVVLTGAGISTESGIPDFRSPTGLWSQFDPYDYGSIESFRADPARVWSFYSLRIEMLARAQPNAGHRAIAELERRGLVRAVVTQNIDMLHERAGSREVVEVHGSVRTSSCPTCGRRYPVVEVLRLLPVPTCSDDGTVLKPDVVFFGELLPAGAMERALALAQAAELVLVVGSTLEVQPVAGLPLEASRFAIVNRGRTALDGRAALRIEGGAGETLAALAEALA